MMFNLWFYERAYKVIWPRLVREHFDVLTSFTSFTPLSTQRYMRGNSNRYSWKVVVEFISSKWESKWFYIYSKILPCQILRISVQPLSCFRRTDGQMSWLNEVNRRSTGLRTCLKIATNAYEKLRENCVLFDQFTDRKQKLIFSMAWKYWMRNMYMRVFTW